MPIPPSFPTDPYAILDPAVRWYPGDEQFGELGYQMLLAPLVHKVRRGVKEWRDDGYPKVSPTTRALLHHWFGDEHFVAQPDGAVSGFRWYFAQREAVESAIWLYEVRRDRAPDDLIRHDSSGALSLRMFDAYWPRYIFKMATGAGKTKVMSLLMAWSYFHKLYEPDSPLSTNFLLIAPNIIVLDRLRDDFDGARIFYADPILPDNGWEGRDWRDDFRLTVHIQDEIGVVGDRGNLFLSNIHRVFSGDKEPSIEDADTTDYFLGRKPKGKTTDSGVDLGVIVRDVPDLVVLNDEAHHIREETAWYKAIEEIALRLRQKGTDLSAQFDLTATPRHNNGAIFVQTVSDYPLVEAIRQQIVKTPVLPDEASRAKLVRRTSDKFAEEFRDYLDLGYKEWKKVHDELRHTGKKPVLFVMTDDTRNCDEVGEFLRGHYPEFGDKDAVLVIHTKNNGEISEASSGKSRDELEALRRASRSIDDADSPTKAIVSVMVLREGWDVQNVTTIVGLRPYSTPAKILPEQTLGRGLRRMFRGERVREKVSVVGTDAFMEFVESLKNEGLELERAPMGESTPPASPMIIEVDDDNPKKDIEALDIELPELAPRIHREYKNLESLDVSVIGARKHAIRQFSAEEMREIVFRDLDLDEKSHVTRLESDIIPNPQSVIGFFARGIMRDLRLVGGFHVLFGKIKAFIEGHLFERGVELTDLNVLRNLSEVDVTRTLIDSFKAAINRLTVLDRGSSEIRGHIKFGRTRPYPVNPQRYITPKRSIFNRIVGNGFELEFAGFLDSCKDVVSFIKNSQSTRFKVEYRNTEGGIANYYPDFIVKRSQDEVWLVETKGREDIEDPGKWERLKVWCVDATRGGGKSYRPLFVREDDWDKYQPTCFSQLVDACEERTEGNRGDFLEVGQRAETGRA